MTIRIGRSHGGRSWRSLTALPCAAALALGAIPGTAVAVQVTYVQIDANGLPQQRGKDAGDIDRDGLADLVIASAAGGVLWYKNPSRAKRVIDPGIATTGPITVADLDGVRGNDVIVPIAGGAVWFANNGSGTAWTRRTLLSDQKVHDAEVGDVDGDGKPDVVVRNEYPSSTTVTVLRQLTPAAWARTTIALPEPGSGLAMADLDRDGKPDLAIGKYWYRNNSAVGAVSFRAPRAYNLAAEQDALIATGDINGDRRLDLFVTAPHPSFPGGGKTAWYAQPSDLSRTWQQHVLETYARREYHSAVVADLDEDGDNDLATATTVSPRASAKVKVFLNGGNGAFGAPFIVANANSHEMQLVNWRGKPSLFGSSKSSSAATSVDLWQISP